MATARAFGPLGQSLAAGALGSLAGATDLQCALFTSALVPTYDEQYLLALTGEVADASYARRTLTGVTVTYDTSANVTVVDCDDIIFPMLTATVRWVVFFRDTLDPATSPLLVIWDLLANESSAGADYTLIVDPGGLIRIAT